ncbi:MAG: hypothetical protein ACREFJ_16450 [Acetobacteraceae bacterium]
MSDSLLPGRVTLAEISQLARPGRPMCERAIRNLVARLEVPWITVGRQRWYDPADIRRALAAQVQTRTPRRPGRPRSRAA